MASVTKEMLIGDVIQLDAQMPTVLMQGGMHCVGCPSAQSESLEEAAMVHGIEPELLVARINAFLESVGK